jgi:tRNA A-37 threonylcarbamoyl transferase component Bud32
MVLEKGDLLQSGKYQIVRQLGGGGFGLTYLAEDTALRRQVVIKTPNRVFQQDQEYQKFIDRFQREGRALAKISHPSVVRVFDIFQERGMPCLVMDYVQGETLNQHIRNQGPLTQNEAVQCFWQLATALQQIHQADLMHCDVHPGNVILRQVSEPILIDFGSTKSLQPSTRTVTTTVNDYAPYEQGLGQDKPNPTLDIYSLAATLYLAVTGHKPLPAMNRKLYGDMLQPPKERRTELSDWLNQAILKGMELEAKDRPQSMKAWIGLLSPPQPQTPTPSVKETQQQSPSPPTAQQPKPAFPWVVLGFLALGYVPTGFALGCSVWIGALALGWALGWVLALAGAGALALAGAGALGWVLALAGAGALALVLGWTGDLALALALVGALAGALALTLAGALAVKVLQERYSTASVFIILGMVNTLGLILGGGLGLVVAASF